MNRWILSHLKVSGPRRIRARIPRAALVFLGLCAFVCGGIGAPIVRADDAANEAARELARKLEAQLDPKQAISIQIQDLTGELTSADYAGVVTAFTSELFSHGFRVISDGSIEPTVRLTLSAISNSRLWIAEFSRDARPEVILISFAKGDGRVVPTETGSLRIERRLIFEQADPILDFAVIKRKDAAPAKILILGTENLAMFDQIDSHWRFVKSVPIPHKSPIPRDPRGMLFIHKQNDSFFAGTFGTTCDGDFRPGLSLKCNTPSFGWSFAIAPDAIFIEGLVKNRNFFQPILGGQSASTSQGQAAPQRPNSYSWEILGWSGDTVIIEARLDGRIWLQLGEERSLPLALTLGSDITRIGGGCVNDTAILATGGLDYTNTDQMQIFQITDRRLDAVGSASEVSGPINSLHHSGSDPVRAVVHNLKTGNYEAYEITLACDH